MIDIHSHVLPGIDDGFKSVEDSVAGCRMAYEDGIRTIIATPHMKDGAYYNDTSQIRDQVARLQEALDSEGIGITLAVGSEVYFSSGLVDGIRSGKLATLADGGRYLLLELPHQQQPVKIEEVIFALKVAGITPILAHPERIRYFQQDLDRLERLLRLGALSQMTSSSLTGDFGERVETLSLEMVHRRMVHFIASDTHDLRYRPPIVSRALRVLASLVGEETAGAAVLANPEAVLAGEPIDPPEPLAREDGRRDGSGISRFWRWMRPR